MVLPYSMKGRLARVESVFLNKLGYVEASLEAQYILAELLRKRTSHCSHVTLILFHLFRSKLSVVRSYHFACIKELNKHSWYNFPASGPVYRIARFTEQCRVPLVSVISATEVIALLNG